MTMKVLFAKVCLMVLTLYSCFVIYKMDVWQTAVWPAAGRFQKFNSATASRKGIFSVKDRQVPIVFRRNNKTGQWTKRGGSHQIEYLTTPRFERSKSKIKHVGAMSLQTEYQTAPRNGHSKSKIQHVPEVSLTSGYPTSPRNGRSKSKIKHVGDTMSLQTEYQTTPRNGRSKSKIKHVSAMSLQTEYPTTPRNGRSKIQHVAAVSKQKYPTTLFTFEEEQRYLNCLADGHFIKTVSNDTMVKNVFNTLHGIWTHHKIPFNLEREDLQCGNLSFSGAKSFKALCNPYGPTPCCNGTNCIKGSVKECQCKTCLDVRQQTHTELADYRLNSRQCKVVNVEKKNSACDILTAKNVTNLIVIGDSLSRQLFVGLMIHLRNDKDRGAMKANMPKDERKLCVGPHQFTRLQCISHMDKNGTVCGGKIRVQFGYASKVARFDVAKKILLPSTPKSSIVVNCAGSQENFMENYMIKNYFDPLMKIINSLQHKTKQEDDVATGHDRRPPWPRFIFMTPHLAGLMKSLTFTKQQSVDARRYASAMTSYFKVKNIPVFNTHKACKNVFAYDGTHYCGSFNMAMAKIMLSFISHL